MDISEVVARAPWNDPARTPSEVHGEILQAFLAAHRRCSLRLLIPSASRRFAGASPVHPWPELFLQVSGERRFRFPAGSGVAGPGEAVLVPRGTPHDEVSADRGRGHGCLVAMCFAGRLSLHCVSLGRDGRQHMVQNDLYADDQGAGSDRLCDELALAARERDDQRGNGALFEVLLLHLLACVRGRSLLLGGHPTLVDRCLRLLAVRLHETDLTVGRLAAELDCHPDHLGRVFHQATGGTLVASIARRRVELAAGLLAEGRAGVREVAMACGFRDASYFSRVFRRYQGMGPRAFVQRGRRYPQRES